MATSPGDFPFEEIRMEPDGDLFPSVAVAQKMTGLGLEHIWSICESYGEDGMTTWTYGPSHHYVNVVGFVATQEEHDGNTYFDERFPGGDDE